MSGDTESSMPPQTSVRVAVEGCGHGTLDAIYDSVLHSCKIKGWDGVDLVIIGGDFQAVRNQHDLNVTAMPAKYRQMADFHQYYYGSKVAPFLTIFIGGNHEASNYLWELYYGGWVAPNIYYLGAANVIRFGPLKIAAMSGIWKGHDYRKPHFERLPYSDETMRSIYHVRELDVRKLLSYSTQVDIGLSHDWPNGVEWLGNYGQLFRYKSFLRDDAQQGRLGNTAARQVMDRLRPPYWFSAHLHTKYAAFKDFTTSAEDEIRDRELGAQNKRPRHISQHKQTPHQNLPPSHANRNKVNSHVTGEGNQEALSAWNNFHSNVRKDEMEQDAKLVHAAEQRQNQADLSGVPAAAMYSFDETFKEVQAGKEGRIALDSSKSPELKTNIPQLDGTCYSIPRKRPRQASSQNDGDIVDGGENFAPPQATGPLPTSVATDNPNAIDIDTTDDDAGVVATKEQKESSMAKNPDAIDLEMSDSDEADVIEHAPQSDSNAGASATSRTLPVQAPQAAQFNDASARSRGTDTVPPTQSSPSLPDVSAVPTDLDVSDDVRAQLAAMSGTFVEQESFEPSPRLPHPSETITNTQTRFLALSKCEVGQHFLQLLEIEPCENSGNVHGQPPKLQYDPEWLAIQRVFASELELGGAPTDRVPPHRGDTHYRSQVLQEEDWIRENIVNKSLLDVPQNFVQTVTWDSDAPSSMPREETNTQTVQFCELIGIANKFDFDEIDRNKRMENGPPAGSNNYRNRGRGQGRGFGRWGGRGGRNHGRGRGRR